MMRAPSQHILFLATEYDAPGMRPYARNIINALWQPGDHVLIVSRDAADGGAFPSVPEGAITWIGYPTAVLEKAIFRFHPTRVLQAIHDLIDGHDITLIYSLTEELILADTIRTLQRRIPVLYTVHDATFHAYKAADPVRWLKNRIILARPQRLMLERTVLQVTNSREQQDLVSQRYKDHKVHYAPFPSLVGEAIERGGKPVGELRDVEDGYILFFGTLHLYKGVHLLYDTYSSHAELQSRHLVIAGSQNIYFNRRPDDGNNVTFINRYIDDSELRDLFGRASVVVYPYTSATQSGVTSIASYFGKPMVLSDIPFFKGTCEGFPGIEFFAPGDSDALATAIQRSLSNPCSSRPIYDSIFTPQALNSVLNAIINQALNA